MRVLIAAGSSGGHIFPAIATARKLKEKDPQTEIAFVGSDKGLDKRIFDKTGYAFYPISSKKRIIQDLILSMVVLKKTDPDVVVGFGGYVSVPILLMAKFMRKATLIHEQNCVPGLANRMLSKVVDKITISYDDALKYFEKKSIATKTGNPIRDDLYKVPKGEVRRRWNLDPDKFTLLVMGGSQGANFINTKVLEALEGIDSSIKDAIQVVHLSGRRDFDLVNSRYSRIAVKNVVFSFSDNMGDTYSASDLVISRAGATSLSEITLFGLPSILIPYPKRRVRQLENALYLQKQDAAIAIEQRDFSPWLLREVMQSLLKSKDRINTLSKNSIKLAQPEAAQKLASEIIKLYKSKGKRQK